MKEISPPFRLYDFLAYLFPGIAMLHAIFLIMGDKAAKIGLSLTTHESVANIIILISISYVAGLFCSVVNREIIRKQLWRFGNPRIDYFDNRNSLKSPLTIDLVDMLVTQAKTLFGCQTINAEQAHRLCRAFVAQNCPTIWEARQSILAVRSMSANFITPAILYGFAFALHGYYLFLLISFLIILALSIKTITLDQREWKDIYFAFIVYQATNNIK